MNKRDFTRRVAEVMRDKDKKRVVTFPAHTFHIKDDEGNSKTFKVRKKEKELAYTVEDVNDVINACFDVIEECMRVGDPVTIFGFGTFGLKYRAPRTTRRVDTGEVIAVPEHYVPKFTPGNSLKIAARIYENTIAHMGLDKPLPVFDIDEEDEDGESDMSAD